MVLFIEMKKYIILSFILTLVIVIVVFIKNTRFSENNRAIIEKPKYLCDTTITNCDHNSKTNIPNGVCVPGGSCT